MKYALILFAMIAAMAIGPWWLFVPVAAGIAFFFGNSAWLCLASGLGWLLPALSTDAANGLRISLRIGGALGLPSRLFVYLIILLAGCLLGSLAATAAVNLRALLPPKVQRLLSFRAPKADTLAD